MKKAEIRMKEINRILGSEARKRKLTRKELARALKKVEMKMWAD